MIYANIYHPEHKDIEEKNNKSIIDVLTEENNELREENKKLNKIIIKLLDKELENE